MCIVVLAIHRTKESKVLEQFENALLIKIERYDVQLVA